MEQVEQFTEINKLCNVESCWLYLEIIYDTWTPERRTSNKMKVTAKIRRSRTKTCLSDTLSIQNCISPLIFFQSVIPTDIFHTLHLAAHTIITLCFLKEFQFPLTNCHYFTEFKNFSPPIFVSMFRVTLHIFEDSSLPGCYTVSSGKQLLIYERRPVFSSSRSRLRCP